MNILHLVSDEKFIHFIADTFNVCRDVGNTFYAVVDDSAVPLKYISDLPDLHVVDRGAIRSKAMKQDLKRFDAVVVHSLDLNKAALISMAPPHIPVVWSGWGGDYYCFFDKGEKSLLGAESLALYKSLNHRRGHSDLLQFVKAGAKNVLRPIFNGIIRRPDAALAVAVRRADYFSSPIPDDFDLLKSRWKSDFRAQYAQISYGSVEKTFAPGSGDITGNNILVGNSATFTNNHFEIFRRLSAANIEAEKIIVPLSYGHAAYRDAVIGRGRKLFGDSFHPVLDFMSLEQYNSLIGSCSVVVMGHRRQQAVGNTATMLYKGANVFLDETSTVYGFLKKRGAVVHGLKELSEGGMGVLAQLTREQKSRNREVLESFWGHQAVLKNTRDLVATLRSHGGRASA